MKKPGFTLVELLVVIAIITLLMALSIGALHRSKERTKSLLCMSRIRQLTVGLTMYEQDNQAFPYGFRHKFTRPPGGYPGSPAYDMLGWWWIHSIQGYGDTDGAAFICPSKSLRLSRFRECILYGNYGVNRSICKSPPGNLSRSKEFGGTPLGVSGISQPSRSLLIVDSGYSIITWWYATDVPPETVDEKIGEDSAYIPGLKIYKNKRNLSPEQEQDAVGGRHPNKAVNVGFADGHVNATKAKDLFVEKTAEGYTNRTPLWTPN